MWKRNKLHILTVATTLSSAAFCLDTVPPKPQEKLIRHGTLLVGNQRKYFSTETEDADGATDGYQANQPEEEVGYQLAKIKLQQLRPSVWCDNDTMTLRMLGKRVPDILVERDGKSPVPLSEMPAHCGLSVKRARRDVFLVAKYDGCHMTQEGDNYILPLRLWGAPVKMGCPVQALFLTVSCTLSAMVIQVGIAKDSLRLKVNGERQPLAQACDTCGFTLEAVPSGWVVTAPYMSKCWQIEGDKRLLAVMYSDGEFTLSCPLDTTSLPADEEFPAAPPILPIDYPFPYAGHQFWPFYLGYPGTLPSSPTATAATSSTMAATTVKPPSADERFWNPNGHLKHWLFYPSYPGSYGAYNYPGAPQSTPTNTVTNPAPTSTTIPTTAATTAKPCPTTTNPTTATASVKPPGADERFWNPHGHPKHWLFHPSYPGTYGAHGYPGAPQSTPTNTVTNPAPTSTTIPTTAATTAKPVSADERFWNPYSNPNKWRFYPGCPGAPPKIPATTAPATTAPATTAPATTAPATTATTPTSTVKPPPSAEQQQQWSPFLWLPTVYDPSVYSNAMQAYRMPWMPYPHKHYGRDQKGLLPVATASVVNGNASDKWMYPWQKWYYPTNQMPGAPQLQVADYPSAATRHEHQGMLSPYLWPMYHSPSRQPSRDTGIDPKLTFDQTFASRGTSSLLFPGQLSPLQIKAGSLYKGSDLVPSG